MLRPLGAKLQLQRLSLCGAVLLACIFAAVVPTTAGYFYDWMCTVEDDYNGIHTQLENGAPALTELTNDPPLLAGGTRFPVSAWIGAEYTKHLHAAPVLTKAITSAVVGFVGDVLAQWFEMRRAKPETLAFNWLRSAAVVVDGLILTGPGLHFLYGSLEEFVPTAEGGFVSIGVHVLMDEFVFDPIFVALFFVLTGLLEGKRFVGDIVPQIRREYFTAVASLWGLSFIFIPLQYLSFKYCPLEFRVLVVNLMDVIWTAVMSFFSHKEEGDP